VIIGSGISGASAAYHLSQDEDGKKLECVMLEAREACWGATGRVRLSSIPPLKLFSNGYIEWRPLPANAFFPRTRYRKV
jgi:glycine/D-amino acid oxidase-like deaminating enzyme